ncbi:MAG: hypothetical protein JXX29_21185 [Deltaproteobacteria bacterium]|nr:hypothetical protein [Deltaproteobacteria bacterium]MBN2674210.1 hypothetical protein [Deltaproteobacteria bacterium]
MKQYKSLNNNIRFSFHAVLSATIRAFAVLVALDVILEWAFDKIFAVQVKAMLPDADFNGAFTFIYFTVIFVGLFGILTLYAVGRPLFRTRLRAALAVGTFIYLYTGLLIIQLFNFGLLPETLLIVMGVTNSIELPAALAMGVSTLSEPTVQK